jgi:hypothetical protein
LSRLEVRDRATASGRWQKLKPVATPELEVLAVFAQGGHAEQARQVIGHDQLDRDGGREVDVYDLLSLLVDRYAKAMSAREDPIEMRGLVHRYLGG